MAAMTRSERLWFIAREVYECYERWPYWLLVG